jgi:hypothetical protein
LGLRILGFRVQGIGFRGEGSGFGVWGLGIRVYSFISLGLRFRDGV